ncbi:MAG: Low molecular weight protein-tyrosine-phosphatase YfkJ [Chlamydiae bacterium]|nr:Low molecular weight protein-tyrosine-phosphatase YfkJ [Chlamydiota bacterium]
MQILFVCLGNICRSPALEATLRDLIEQKGLKDQIQVDSCALNPWFLTSKADLLMIKTAQKRGITITSRAKLFSNAYFDKFSYIFAVDKSLLEVLKSMAPSKKEAEKVHLATEFSDRFLNEDIPDPYRGEKDGFELTMDIVENVSFGIMRFLETQI